MNPLARKLVVLTGLGLALGSAAYVPEAAARTQVAVQIGVAPPPPRFERAPPPRRGYAWAPGYWRWSPHMRRHVWVTGYWIPARPGYHYRPAGWVRYGNGWRFHGGGWRR
ncbi:hypothetical protein [Dyella subtropica]|uniref:hypothetical protein n=1 Tax=Dyella subtropica TaxID=2992127 RepID=UPI0022585FF1|nr:hypothetical protein [Dyella subtropica]